MTSLARIRKELERAVESENQNVIACYHENIICGLCCYHWDHESNYAQASIFVISDRFSETATEMISYIEESLGNHSFLIGFPTTNKLAIDYFKIKNWRCIESSIVTNMIGLKPKSIIMQYDLIKITENNFDEYSNFHDRFSIPNEMYYTSKNLMKDIKGFEILAYRENGKFIASIFAVKGKELSDIIGLFIDESYRNREIEKSLLNGLLNNLSIEYGEVGEILYFIDDDNDVDLQIALESGFTIKERYKCYETNLKGKC
jgi:hypothetical protein